MPYAPILSAEEIQEMLGELGDLDTQIVGPRHNQHWR